MRLISLFVILFVMTIGCDRDCGCPQLPSETAFIEIHIESSASWYCGEIIGFGFQVIVIDLDSVCLPFRFLNREDLHQGDYLHVWAEPNGTDSVTYYNFEGQQLREMTVCGVR